MQENQVDHARGLSRRPPHGPAHDALGILTSWWLIGSLGVWAINDQIAKFTWPGLVTGKLSDVLGLFALPLVGASASTLLVSPSTERTRQLIGAVWYVAIALGFAAVKCSADVAASASGIWSVVLPTRIVADSTDLVALAVVPVGSFVWLRRPSHSVRRIGKSPGIVRRVAGALVVLSGITVTTATGCWDPAAVTQVFVGTNGSLYATGQGASFAISDDGGTTWVVKKDGEVPDPSVDQQLAGSLWEADDATFDDESDETAGTPVDPPPETSGIPSTSATPAVATELCTDSRCWSLREEEFIIETDLDTGRMTRIPGTGGNECLRSGAPASMTLFRHGERDVLVAANADKGVIRIADGESARYVEFSLD